MSNFHFQLSSFQREVSGIIYFNIVNSSSKILSVIIQKFQIKSDGENLFSEVNDFNLLVFGNPVEKSFKMELDPFETREYGLKFSCDISYEFELTFIERNSNETVIFSGKRSGIPKSELQKPNEIFLNQPIINMNVRINPTDYNNKEILGNYIVVPEPGTPNDFGIFNKHEINPTAAYIDMGRDGYKTLIGKFFEKLDWDRDTIASPPSDLYAVHIQKIDSNEHGWLFRSSLLIVKQDD